MKSIPKISLLVLLLLSVLLFILFYVGGNDGSIVSGGESLDVPVYTNPLIYWTYTLMLLSGIITVGILVLQFIGKLKEDVKAAMKSLIGIGLMAAIMLLSYVIGSGDAITIVGYEGTDNSGFWAQFTDMCLYSAYILLGGAFLAIIGAGVYKQLNK